MTSRNWTPPISPAPRAGAHLKCDPVPSLSPAPLTRKFGRVPTARRRPRAQYFLEWERTWCWRWSARGGRRRRPARAAGAGARRWQQLGAQGQQTVGSKVSRPLLPHAGQVGQAGQRRRGRGATPLPSPCHQPKLGFGARQGVAFGEQSRACADEFRTRSPASAARDSLS